jgi:transposase
MRAYGADDEDGPLSPSTREDATVPGASPVVALTYRATVDEPARFRNSKAVGPMFGLTLSKYQSGEIKRAGAIGRDDAGDAVRSGSDHAGAF